MISSSASRPERRSLWLRSEDLALAGWSLALPGVTALAGALSPGTVGGTDGVRNPLAGAVQLLAVAGAIAAILTRPPDQPGVRIAGQDAPRWVICGPLMGGLAYAVVSATGNLGMASGEWIFGVVLVAIVVSSMAADRLPVVQAPIRRLLVVPFILVSSAYFNGFAATFLQSIDIGTVAGSFVGADVSFAAFVGTMILGAMAAFYAMFVVAPRELADPEDAGFRWIVRFALFLASSLLGIGWLTILGG